MIQERLNTYDKDQCWQYDIRVKNLEEDLAECGFTREYIETLRVPDFSFVNVTDKKEQQKLKQLIESLRKNLVLNGKQIGIIILV